MGACASSQFTSKGGNFGGEITVSIIHLDGRLQQFKEPIKAGHVLSHNPNCFLCSSESMYVDSLLPHVDPTEELHFDQIYFLLPLSKSQIPLSLQYLCLLAIKANAALAHSESETITNSIPKSHTNRLTHTTLRGYSH
ncbi:hypothetical protein SESBI_43782 [Sesbania bispinosa]|nr:hypothetical protein SESBI_43782 [Sesbania bispinosa]